MKFHPETPRVAFTIAKRVFSCPAPFAEGHILTAGEAAALNQTLRENVRNNLAAETDLTQDKVDEYVAEYQFGVRPGGPKRSREEIIRDAVVLEEAEKLAAAMNKKLPPAKDRKPILEAVAKRFADRIAKEVARRMKAAPVEVDEELANLF